MEPFTLHLLRHGMPERAGRLLGRTDCPPTAAGIEACVAQAHGLAVEAIVSSDLSRASLAANAIGRRLGISPAIDPRWRELDFGAWDGLAVDEVDQQAFRRFRDDPDAAPPPQGERWSALVARVGAALAELSGGDVLIVTHGGAMRAAIAHLCGLAQRDTWAFALGYSALLSLQVWPGDPRTAQVAGLQP